MGAAPCRRALQPKRPAEWHGRSRAAGREGLAGGEAVQWAEVRPATSGWLQALARQRTGGGTGTVQSAHNSGLQRLAASLRHYLAAVGSGGRSGVARSKRAPIFYSDIVITDGSELKDELLRQGLSPDEVILKHCWPRYAPPAEAGIRSIAKSENLLLQFDRLVAMHRVTPSSVPMPAAVVKSSEGEFAGYILEHVEGDTLQSLISSGQTGEARRQLGLVEKALEKLHAKSLPHGDVNASNIIVADDGRTLLIDPVASPGPGAKLQDAICLEQIRRQIEEGATERGAAADS